MVWLAGRVLTDNNLPLIIGISWVPSQPQLATDTTSALDIRDRRLEDPLPT